MKRKYNSSRRKKASEQTRQDILQAALKLHWDGVTEFEALAKEAGCSLATVRKHFPTKEALYRHCTRTFGETLTMPDMEALSKMQNQAEQLAACIAELCRIHEAMFGYAWHSAYLRRNSPTLDAEMKAYEGLADAIVTIIAPAGAPKAAVIRGFLDFLTYRALRLSGKLSPKQTVDELIATIAPLVGAGT